MDTLLIYSRWLPEDEVPKEMADEYAKERKAQAYAKAMAKRGLAVSEVKTPLGYSYDAAVKQVIQEVQEKIPLEGVRIRALSGEVFPSEGPGLEGFVRVMQVQQGWEPLGFKVEHYQITIGVGDSRFRWKFLVAMIG